MLTFYISTSTIFVQISWISISSAIPVKENSATVARPLPASETDGHRHKPVYMSQDGRSKDFFIWNIFWLFLCFPSLFWVVSSTCKYQQGKEMEKNEKDKH